MFEFLMQKREILMDNCERDAAAGRWVSDDPNDAGTVLYWANRVAECLPYLGPPHAGVGRPPRRAGRDCDEVVRQLFPNLLTKLLREGKGAFRRALPVPALGRDSAA